MDSNIQYAEAVKLVVAPFLALVARDGRRAAVHLFFMRGKSMDTTFPGTRWPIAASPRPALWQAGYGLIIAGEGLTL